MVVVCVDLTDAGAPVDAEEWLQKVTQATGRSLSVLRWWSREPGAQGRLGSVGEHSCWVTMYLHQLLAKIVEVC